MATLVLENNWNCERQVDGAARLANDVLKVVGIGLTQRLEKPRKLSGLVLADDDGWLSRVMDGDEDAASALVERLYPTVIKSVRCHRPRRTSEEDMVQCVFLKVFSKLHQFSGLVPLEHWVSRIAINTCLNQLQHESVRPELRMSDLSEQEQAVAQRLILAEDELPPDQSHAARELLERLMAHLDAGQRLVVTLLHIEERSVEHVSRMTGWSASLVKVKAFRARRKMRKIWKTLLQSERP